MAAEDIQHMTGLGLKKTIAGKDKLFFYHRHLNDLTEPILVLIHGYPQSSFMWRHIIPLIPTHVPLFIPDIPGYGRSAPLSVSHSKLNQGAAILSTLSSLLPLNKKQPLILVGHDRGARICHRLAIDTSPTSSLPVLGVILLDIVPTLVQWETFKDAKASTGSFHWPFLANVELATKMIQAQGGDIWTRTCLERWVGKSEVGLAKFQEHGAVGVYANFLQNESVIRATCDDYRAGAEEDIELQVEDQKLGRKIDIPVAAVYSKDYLGKRYDVKKVWEEWIADGARSRLEAWPIGGEVGHFIAEEAPEKVVEFLERFYNRLSFDGLI
jgi:pimeloyl-ACP methyl ester carboxylesterase